MTKAYICDKCGLILPACGNVRTIYTVSPKLFTVSPNDSEIDLCEECYGQFEREYMKNLTEEGSDD